MTGLAALAALLASSAGFAALRPPPESRLEVRAPLSAARAASSAPQTWATMRATMRAPAAPRDGVVGRGPGAGAVRLAMAGAGAAGGGGAWWVSGSPVIALVVVAGVTAAGGAAHRAHRDHARRQRRGVALEVVAAMVGELRAGRSREAALAAVAGALSQEAPGGLGPALVRAAGADDVPAQLLVVAAGELEALRRLAACWRVAEVTGAELAPALDRISAGVRAEETVRRRTAAALAGPRSSATLLALLPLATLGLGETIGAQPFAVLSTPLGLLCLGSGLPLLAAGLAWTRLIARRAERWAT